MTPQERAAEFAREHPEAAAALRAEGGAAAATAERERIQSVRAQALPGHEQLIEQLAFDGSTTGPEAAAAVVAAERTLAAGRRADLAADTPLPLAAAATGAAEASQRESAAGASPASPSAALEEAQALSHLIQKKQAEAQAAGHYLSAVDALALIRKESSNG